MMEVTTPQPAAPATPREDRRSLTVASMLIALLIILAGMPFRTVLLDRFYLDFDEAMYFQVAQEPTLADAWDASRIHTHPPLAFLIYHVLLPLGDSEWAVRMPSVLFGVLASVVGYAWLARVTDRRAALVGLFVLTFAMPVIHVSSQMRSYTMLFAFVFGAFWFHDRFLEHERKRDLVGEAICFALALLTHYATAWILLTVGIGGLMHAYRRGVWSRGTRIWAIQQLALVAFCGWLYVVHVRGFVGSETQSEMWKAWLHDNPFDDSFLGRLNFSLVSGMRFFRFVFGPIWMLMLVATFAGALLLAKNETDRTGSGFSGLDRFVLVITPLLLAVGLNIVRVYPFGPTRHSLWLMPFLVVAAAGVAKPLLDRPGRWSKVAVAMACLGWAWIYPYRTTFETQTTLTPKLMADTASRLKKWVPKSDLILTDDSTRNVLAYYLGHSSVDRGRDLGHGFREYQIEGYRVVVIPKFHFFQYSLHEDWEHFSSILGDASTQPLWLVYFGYEVKDNDPRSIARRLPPSEVMARGNVGDNQVFKLKFNPPNTKSADAKQPAENKPTGEKSAAISEREASNGSVDVAPRAASGAAL